MNIRRRMGLPRMSFHVMNRGARRATLFNQDEDRQRFVDLMARFCLKNGVKLSAWCLMSNHYHAEPNGEGTPLSHLMHDLDGTYARLFNEKHGLSGCLFQGRYKSMSIRDDRGLAYVSRYIHLNPRDMGEDPLVYRWSSCRAYLGLEPTPAWLDPMSVLRLFGDTLETARDNYRLYLRSAPPRRRKAEVGEDPVDDYLVDYIGHLEETWREGWKGPAGPPSPVALPTFICWYAQRQERIPPHILQEYYGYSSSGTPRVLATRFAKRLLKEPDLAQWALQVNSGERRQS